MRVGQRAISQWTVKGVNITSYFIELFHNLIEEEYLICNEIQVHIAN